MCIGASPLWFHQPCRVDDWLLVHQTSPVAARGRTFGRGDVFTADGSLVASFAQEAMVRMLAPQAPITNGAVSSRVAVYLQKAGIRIHRPGGHTLRHTCVQRLIDAEFPLKTIGDYVGHRSSESTRIYTKVALASLREVAMGDGEAL